MRDFFTSAALSRCMLPCVAAVCVCVISGPAFQTFALTAE